MRALINFSREITETEGQLQVIYGQK